MAPHWLPKYIVWSASCQSSFAVKSQLLATKAKAMRPLRSGREFQFFSSDFFFCISLEWLNNTLFGKELAVGLELGLFRNAFSRPRHGCLSVRSLASWNRSTCTSCIVHIAFRWLPFPFGQVWCRPYLVANVGLLKLRTFPWRPSKVKAGTFYPFILKVGSKYT